MRTPMVRPLFALALVIFGIGRLSGDASALTGTTIDIKPSIHCGGGNVADYGLHYDESGAPAFGAYDFSGCGAGVGTNAWPGAQAQIDQIFPARYMYWTESACSVKGRLQRYVSGSWTDYYDWDVRVLHLANMPQYTSYTQQVTYNGDWLYVVVGTLANCATSQPHAHLSAYLNSSFIVTSKSDDTCWTDSSQCSIGTVKKHDIYSTCPPGSWNTTGTGRSGTVSQYICETWSLRWRSDQTSVFRVQ